MCREKREWERASRKWSALWIQQYLLGPSVPWSPLWWWIQPGSLPKSLFYAPSLARGEGRVGSHCATCSGLGLVVIGGVCPGVWKVTKSSVLFVTRLAQFALAWWHIAVEGCCKKYWGQNWNSAFSATGFPTKVKVFCNNFDHRVGVLRDILQILLTLSLQMQLWSVSPYKMN